MQWGSAVNQQDQKKSKALREKKREKDIEEKYKEDGQDKISNEQYFNYFFHLNQNLKT